MPIAGPVGAGVIARTLSTRRACRGGASVILYVYVAWFFAVPFLANAIPHIVQGICGNRFQTPFASSPSIGESSAIVNVIWGFANVAIGGGLLFIFLPPLPPAWPLFISRP